MITTLEGRLTIIAVITLSMTFWLVVTVIVFWQLSCARYEKWGPYFGHERRRAVKRKSYFKYHFVGALILINNQNSSLDECVCDVTIVHRHWAISSAHCVDIFNKFDKELIRIVSNSHTWQMGQEHRINKYLVHKSFTQNRYDYDIAIIKVIKPFVGTRVTIARLPDSNYDYRPNSTAVVLSWGLDNDASTTSGKLKKANVLLLDRHNCDKYSALGEKITDKLLCTESFLREDKLCQYQPGSPLVQQFMVVAINLWGTQCDVNDLPEVYVKLAYFKDSIEGIVNDSRSYNESEFILTVVEKSDNISFSDVILRRNMPSK